METKTKFRLRGNQIVITSAGEFSNRFAACEAAEILATKMSVPVAVDQLRPTMAGREWECVEVMEP